MSAPAAASSPGGWPGSGPYYPSPAWSGPAPWPNTSALTAAMVLSIVGGGFIILGGVFWISVWTAVGATGPYWFGLYGGALAVLGAVGIGTGALVVLCAILAHLHPERHELFGAVIVGLSFVSLTSFLGGFLFGFLLTLIGGILLLAWRPTVPVPYYPMQPPILRVCPRCGRVLDVYSRFCPLCGNPVEPAIPHA